MNLTKKVSTLCGMELHIVDFKWKLLLKGPLALKIMSDFSIKVTLDSGDEILNEHGFI